MKFGVVVCMQLTALQTLYQLKNMQVNPFFTTSPVLKPTQRSCLIHHARAVREAWQVAQQRRHQNTLYLLFKWFRLTTLKEIKALIEILLWLVIASCPLVCSGFEKCSTRFV